jgi:hypothetical protein
VTASRNERIDFKVQALKQLDPEREVELEDAFTNHVEAVIRSRSSARKCQQEMENAIEVYEDALTRALYEILENHIANEDSSLASSCPSRLSDSRALGQPPRSGLLLA